MTNNLSFNDPSHQLCQVNTEDNPKDKHKEVPYSFVIVRYENVLSACVFCWGLPFNVTSATRRLQLQSLIVRVVKKEHIDLMSRTLDNARLKIRNKS